MCTGPILHACTQPITPWRVIADQNQPENARENASPFLRTHLVSNTMTRNFTLTSHLKPETASLTNLKSANDRLHRLSRRLARRRSKQSGIVRRDEKEFDHQQGAIS